MNNRLGIVADERFLQHETGQHVESPERLRVIYRMLERERIFEKAGRIESRYASEEEVALNHSDAYIRMLKNKGAGYLDADTVLSVKSFDTALLAVGGCLNMTDAIIAGNISSGFALIRPPGHHAEFDRGMGFCLFNNIAITARRLQQTHGMKRIAIVDWDLHHGNGTQRSFYAEKEILYLSIHQSPCYPGTGMFTETGEREGEGFTINLPVPAGIGDDGYIKTFQFFFRPIISNFEPQMILVSAGFDAHEFDPLGGMEVSAEGFATIGKILMDLAYEYCDGKIAFFLEGGYSLEGLTESVKEVIHLILEGKDFREENLTTGIPIDPYLKKAASVHQKYHGTFDL